MNLKNTITSFCTMVFILEMTSSVLFDLSVSFLTPKSASLSSMSLGMVKSYKLTV